MDKSFLLTELKRLEQQVAAFTGAKQYCEYLISLMDEGESQDSPEVFHADTTLDGVTAPAEPVGPEGEG